MNSEIEILERLVKRVGRSGRLVLGIGDDCAIYRQPGSNEDLLLTTDLLIEGVHFRRETHPAAAVGHKALARGLSDIAAMGGTPRLCLLSLTVAGWVDDAWLDAFFDGLLLLAHKTGATLAGGDLARAERFACDIVVCGSVLRGKALRRDGARAGDSIYVSGKLGASALGLETKKGSAWQRHLRPEPRLELGRFLRDKLRASACMDLSDGLSLDLHRMCLASGVSAQIKPPPIFRGATLDQALHGGEDYELLFTIATPIGSRKLPLTRIGTIVKGQPGTVFLDGRRLEPLGYDHFRR
jgi:thiamine-monophosphate kinase